MTRRRKLSYRQISAMLFDINCGMTGKDAAAKYGLSPQSVSLWKPYTGLTGQWLARVKTLEATVRKTQLRTARAEQQVKIAATVIKQLEPNSYRRSLFAVAIRADHDIYYTRANEIVGVSPAAGLDRRSKHGNALLTSAMRAYIDENPGEGFNRMFRVLLKDKGCTRARALRVYTQARLSMHFRKNRIFLPGPSRERVRVSGAQDRIWSLDFMVDALPNGKRFWVLNAVDNFNRECLFSKALPRSSTRAVVAQLHAAIQTGRKPKVIRSDNGQEFKGLEYVAWARSHSVRRSYSRPGHPTDNVYVERFNGTLRREVFNWFKFKSLEEVQHKLDDWRVRYNLVRPHQALGGLSPVQYAYLAKIGGS